MNQFVGCVVFAAWLTIVATNDFPADQMKCAIGDVECLPNVINNYIKNSANGIPSVGIAPFDPLFVPNIDIIQATNSPVNIKLTFKNVNVYGYSDLRFNKINGFAADPRKSKFELWGTVPRLSLIGDYTVNGNILILPLVGTGLLNMTLDNLDFRMRLKTSVETRNNQDYLHVNKVLVNFNTTRVYMKMDNLFNGDKLLSDTTNAFVNENWRDVVHELKPALQASIGRINRDMMQPLFDKFPYKDLWL